MMWRRRSIMVSVLALVLALSVAGVAMAGGGMGKAGQTRGGAGQQTAATAITLSAEQAQLLAFMLEEEKLARDVYNVLYQKWDTEAFSSIAAAESRHMSSVQRLMDRYGVSLPTTLQAAGAYDDVELQKLYTDLVASGMASEEAALEVGVLVETVDIEDLEQLLDLDGLPRDIARVAGNLLRGSRNHLVAFERLLAE